ncbi:MAG: hypothetical protein ABI548_18250 [Polyangiaceae bacterium]
MRALLLSLALGILALGCSGQPQTTGLTEPVRVGYGSTRNTQFHSGALPGSKPLTNEASLAHVASSPPSLSLNVAGSIIRESDTGFVVSGSTSSEAVAVGIRFLDLGSGYWIVPVTGQDPTRPGTFTWSATLDFGADIPAGLHPLAAVAIDGAGHGGTQTEADLCVASEIPDNLSACSPASLPPTSVVSLAWDAPVDLDLRVITPEGKVVDPKHPSTAVAVDGHVDPSAKGTGIFDTDALRGCVDTAHRRENLVWQDAPSPGTYLVYADLFDACGQAAVRFTLSLNQRVPSEDGGALHLADTYERTGELLAVDANAGTQLGLFVTEFTVQ